MTHVETDTAARIERGDLTLSLDRAFALLADQCCRALLTTLLDRQRGAFVEKLADDLAATEVDRRRIEVSLHHVHLPRLDEANVIEWDRDLGYVEATPLAGELESFLTLAVAPDGHGV